MLQRSPGRIPIAPELAHRPEIREAADKLHDIKSQFRNTSRYHGLVSPTCLGYTDHAPLRLKKSPAFCHNSGHLGML
jgi:hypothetical protein